MTSVTSTTATTTTASSGASPGANPLSSLTSNFGNFLSLLMTQLKNQNPSSPMDANSFTTELVQFSGVEQQINANTSLGQLIKLTQTADVIQASAILGKQVTVQSSQMPLQNGTGTVNFTAPANEPVTVTVLNASGTPLRQATVNAVAGANSWSWNGANTAGQTQPDGAYTVSVATAASGTVATPLSFTVTGKATSVNTANNAITLQMGALSVPFSAVSSVSN